MTRHIDVCAIGKGCSILWAHKKGDNFYIKGIGELFMKEIKFEIFGWTRSQQLEIHLGKRVEGNMHFSGRNGIKLDLSGPFVRDSRAGVLTECWGL